MEKTLYAFQLALVLDMTTGLGIEIGQEIIYFIGKAALSDHPSLIFFFWLCQLGKNLVGFPSILLLENYVLLTICIVLCRSGPLGCHSDPAVHYNNCAHFAPDSKSLTSGLYYFQILSSPLPSSSPVLL